MTLTKEQLDDLVHQLPRLDFVLSNDCDWPQADVAQAYLNAYHINFAHEFTQVSHGFGVVDAAGFRIATHYWLPENAKGTLVVVHGYYDHVGIFANAIRFALERDLAVLVFDLPGHGLSSGAAAEIDSFDHYADVLAELLTQSQYLLPQPLHAIGQSTGGAVILNYLWRYAIEQDALERLQKVVLLAPLILARGWGLGKYLYAVIHPFIRQLKRGRAFSSHDQDFNDLINQQDSLQAKHLSVKWVGAMKQWHHKFCRFAPLQKELLVVQGTGDMTVDWQYNIPLIQRKLPNSKLVIIKDAKHQLVNESDEYRQQVFLAVEHYFNNHTLSSTGNDK